GVAGYVVLAGVLLFLYVKLKPGLETLPWSARMLWLLYLTAATFVLLRLSSVVKVMNYLSLHSFYLWRLRDSYIQKEVDARGKVCAGRSADVPLADLQKDNRAQPWGPYHVIGTALNTSGSADIRNLGRKSDAFFLSPFYSGSSTTGFAPTKEHYPTLKVGEAMAISGAAFSPNQGRATNTSLAILMTLFNARLGFWLKNPRLLSGSKENLSRFPPYLLYWIEMFGKASGSDPYVYLSDGGHFDNSGIYELIRRRCRYIIAVDGSGEPSDKEARFGTIGIVSRLVRIDFGVDIQMDLNLMEPDKEKGHTKSHYALGRIVYPKERDDQKEEDREGLLVYLKASLLGDENAPDLEYYDRISPMFPNHSTADQFFDEAQFESYRALGYHIARDAFRETLVGKITEEQEKGPQKEHWLRLDRLCGRWNQDVIGPPVNG
ncbi:MAG: Patatin-like phospholipase, partial [Dehalococcoidia bacterium]|nr:Patatin-like phospholipase [Dehalococcoidia bacterium]